MPSENNLDLEAYKNEDSILDIGSPPGSVIMSKFQYACAIGNTELVKESLSSASSPADPPAIKDGYQALHLAARYGNLDVVNLLLNRPETTQVEYLKKDQHGFTPLHYAVAFRHLEVVRKILEKDPDAQYVRSTAGVSAQEIAQSLQFLEIDSLFTPNTKSADSHKLLHQWLTSISLSEYYPGFCNAGFDDIDFLRSKGKLEDDDLDAIGVTKVGHRKKLQDLFEFPKDSNTEVHDSTEESDEEDSSEDSTDESDSSEEESSSEDDGDSSDSSTASEE